MSTFSATCARGHLEPIEFGPGQESEFETHMREAHKATPGGQWNQNCRGHWLRWRPFKRIKPASWRAPRGRKPLADVAAEWADSPYLLSFEEVA